MAVVERHNETHVKNAAVAWGASVDINCAD